MFLKPGFLRFVTSRGENEKKTKMVEEKEREGDEFRASEKDKKKK